MRPIYLDHASTTPLDPRVRDRMLPYLSEEFGNPSAIYAPGRVARRAVDDSRDGIARIFGASAEEIIFTGSGTESDNLAILGVARAYNRKPTDPRAPAPQFRHIITSSIEHHAVLRTCEHLEKCENFSVTYLKPDEYGQISPETVAAALTPETILVSVMYANNEIGTINPIAAISKKLQEYKQILARKPTEAPFLHTDACQAAGFLPLNAKQLGVDLMTINGSKIYGPKGIGALYVRRGLKLEPLIHGGGQEFKLRSGTENVASIVGFAEALRLAHEERGVESARLSALRDTLISAILKTIPNTVLNGHPTERLPNNANVSVLGIEGEAILLYLDSYGISASTGSACDSASLEPSHVILGLGRPYEHAHGSIRFTLGRGTTEADIQYVLEVLPKIVDILRCMSPVRITAEETKKIGSQAATDIAGAFVDLGRPHWEK
ncbi:MAG: cysteine desulfurase family protein [bacterium]|nr:cysteine desulfurase family protein [bacterium]